MMASCVELRAVDRLISSSSEQAIPAVRIKTPFNLAFNRVGECCALEIACDFVLDLLLWRRDYRIEQTPQQPGPR
jgi:hypothetical protein